MVVPTDFLLVAPFEVVQPTWTVVVVGLLQRTEEVKIIKAAIELEREKCILNELDWNWKEMRKEDKSSSILQSVSLEQDRRSYLYSPSSLLLGQNHTSACTKMNAVREIS